MSSYREYFVCRRSPRLQKKAQASQSAKENPSTLRYYETTPQMRGLFRRQETITPVALIQHMTREAVQAKSAKDRVDAINELVDYVCRTENAHTLLAAFPPFRFRIQALITKYRDCMPFNSELMINEVRFELLQDILTRNSNFVAEKV